MSNLPALPSPSDQAPHLADLGLAEPSLADRVSGEGLLVVPVKSSRVVPLLRVDAKAGFVVTDMTDVDEFVPVDEVPAGPYLVGGLARGEEYENWTPAEADASIRSAGRLPLTLVEGLLWALAVPGVLERNHCFMTIASRKRRSTGAWDARTPALWISNGTGRDGRENRGAPKLGWCWWGNRHTWLGIASAASRTPV